MSESLPDRATSMHEFTPATEDLAARILAYALERVRMDPPLDGPRSPEFLAAAAGPTITDGGLGPVRALEVFTEVLAPACLSVDHPRFLAFVPAAPTDASVLFDLVVGASSVCASSWLDAAGAVFAENEALAWLRDLAGLPATSGGVFVSGGTSGNLSALITARHRWRRRAQGRFDHTRGLLICSGGAHSSIRQTAAAMDLEVVTVDVSPDGRLTGSRLVATIDRLTADERERVVAVVATAGTTNAGVVDDLDAAADAAARLETWLHVDAAYGGAALAAPTVRRLFTGIERADSLIVDPHKWLFAPFDCCALLYRDPANARNAHTQDAEYLDVLHDGPDWNPSDYAHHLSRRARGLPLWFSLAVHGTDAYTSAVERTLQTARRGREMIEQSPHLELVTEPELSVLLFRRLGWSADDYRVWSDEQLLRGVCFVVPTSWNEETVLRVCIVNPRTTAEDLAEVFASLG